MPQLFGPAPEFETARLRLRPYLAADIDAMAAMFDDAEVTAHTLLGRRTRAETMEVLDRYRDFLADNGYGMYAICDRSDGAYLGEVGTFVPPVDDAPLALRYALVHAAWGRGVAAEASVPIIDDVFDRLGHEVLMAGVVAENTGSVRVMQKLGFSYRHDKAAAGHVFGIFLLHREEWRAGRERPAGG
jgi:ribosomal-protein-alanine N-acetyltransferase